MDGAKLLLSIVVDTVPDDKGMKPMFLQIPFVRCSVSLRNLLR